MNRIGMMRFIDKNDAIQVVKKDFMEIQFSSRQFNILEILSNFEKLTTSQLLKIINTNSPKPLSQITLTRELKPLFLVGFIKRNGKGRAVQYSLTSVGLFLGPVEINSYFKKSSEKRNARSKFNFSLFQEFSQLPIFFEDELEQLSTLLKEYQFQKSTLSPTLLKKEFERVTIELSWKSSAIEGNTYSLLETETLLKEGVEAKGKKAEEAIMLLNHKAALEFVRDNSLEASPLTLAYIEKIHSILTDRLGVSKNLRKTLVGITGTEYRPLDNQFQIREAIEEACKIINSRGDPFTKAFLAIVLISYIQPFEDGNKRCGRIIGNALLLAHDVFPLSFRSVDETEYKKAILLFYERNNLWAFKRIFIEQSKFSVKTYFRSTY